MPSNAIVIRRAAPRPKPDVCIRRARPRDLDALVGLLGALFSIEADFAPDTDKQRRGLTMLLESPATRCALVAEVDGRTVGMCTAQLVVSTAEGGPSALIEDVVVDENFRGRGLGRRLMDAIGEWAEQAGATRLQLLADKNNTPALDFYERIGWAQTQLVCLRRR